MGGMIMQMDRPNNTGVFQGVFYLIMTKSKQKRHFSIEPFFSLLNKKCFALVQFEVVWLEFESHNTIKFWLSASQNSSFGLSLLVMPKKFVPHFSAPPLTEVHAKSIFLIERADSYTNGNHPDSPMTSHILTK